MRIACLDGLAGLSGDMLLGALIDAGAPTDRLHEALAGLGLGAALRITAVDRSGIGAKKVDILVNGHPAETPRPAKASAPHSHSHPHGEHDHPHSPGDHAHPHHHHKHPHPHSHGRHDQAHAHSQADHPGHQHEPVRSLRDIQAIIHTSRLDAAVKTTALRAFELLGAAEAKIHRVPVETLHFHEVGAVDSIADIVLTAVAAHSLGIERWYCAPLNVGGGSVQCAHGRYPVPAPATAELLMGLPTYSAPPLMELVTPTGAALVRALGCDFSPAPARRITAIGYGAGTRTPPGFPNVLRLSLGETEPSAPAAETVTVIETALDDLSPQVIAHVTERALALGARDVMTTPVLMKKGRPGTLLTILADSTHLEALEELLFRETSTLGLRVREDRRITLARVFVEVVTPWGPVRVKVGRYRGAEVNAAPEFEDCRRLAATHNLPVKRVLEAALQAYRQLTP